MTDYEIQKATSAKVGVVSPPDNIYECRKAILEKLGGDSTNADTIYECDKRILPLICGGSTNIQEKSVNITENGTTSVLPDAGYNLSKVDVTVDIPQLGHQEKYVYIKENGDTTVTPDAGVSLEAVYINVNVPPTPTQSKEVTITENGTTSIVPDAGYDLSSVNVTVDVSSTPIVTMTAAEYAAITPDSSTIYLIKD